MSVDDISYDFTGEQPVPTNGDAYPFEKQADSTGEAKEEPAQDDSETDSNRSILLSIFIGFAVIALVGGGIACLIHPAPKQPPKEVPEHLRHLYDACQSQASVIAPDISIQPTSATARFCPYCGSETSQSVCPLCRSHLQWN